MKTLKLLTISAITLFPLIGCQGSTQGGESNQRVIAGKDAGNSADQAPGQARRAAARGAQPTTP